MKTYWILATCLLLASPAAASEFPDYEPAGNPWAVPGEVSPEERIDRRIEDARPPPGRMTPEEIIPIPDYPLPPLPE